MEPVEYFVDTYSFMNDGTFDPPMIGYPAVYTFTRQK